MIGQHKQRTILKKKITLIIAIALVLAIGISVTCCSIANGYSPNRFNSVKCKTSGGGKQENCNLRTLEYLSEKEHEVNIEFSFVSGNGTETDLLDCGVPEYTVSFLEKPLRLRVDVNELIYLDYVVNGINEDSTGLVAGMFYSQKNGVTSFYFNLTDNVKFKVLEDEAGKLTVVLQDQQTKEKTGWYLLCDAYYEYQSDELKLDKFTPTLCADGMSVLMISQCYSSQRKAEKNAEKLTETLGKEVRAIELAGGELPLYTEGTDALISLSESIMSLDGAKASLNLFFANARFICWQPSGGAALFAKTEDDGEKLYTADKSGTKHLIYEKGLATVVCATYSKNEKYIAFVENADETELCSLLDIDNGSVTVLTNDDGESLFGDKISGIALSNEGDKLFVISGDGYYSLKQFDVSTGEIKTLRSNMVVESKLNFLDNKLYYSDCVDERETIICHNLEDDTTESIIAGADFSVAYDGNSMAVITENYATGVCTLNLVKLASKEVTAVANDIITGEYFVSWDGAKVYYAIETGDQEFYYQIMCYDIATGETTGLAQCINAVFYTSNVADEICVSVIYTDENGSCPACYIANFNKLAQAVIDSMEEQENQSADQQEAEQDQTEATPEETREPDAEESIEEAQTE